jgi:hypothetical protein
MEHDASSKLLFWHARRVEDLLHRFIHEAWGREVDCRTLERVSDKGGKGVRHRCLPGGALGVWWAATASAKIGVELELSTYAVL